MPEASYDVSCFIYNENIYLAGYNHSQVYVYHPNGNLYKSILKLKANTCKVIIGDKKKMFVIENHGKIFSSVTGKKGSFEHLAHANFESGVIFGYPLVINKLAYFGVGESFYMFNMQAKSIVRICICQD